MIFRPYANSFCFHKFGLDVSGFKGGKMKRSMATGKNGKFVFDVFTGACRF